MQVQYEKYAPQGFIQITILTQNNSGGPASQSTAATWASQFGLTHPVLADPTGSSESSLVTNFGGYPTFVLYERDVVRRKACAGGGCVSASDIESLL